MAAEEEGWVRLSQTPPRRDVGNERRNKTLKLSERARTFDLRSFGWSIVAARTCAAWSGDKPPRGAIFQRSHHRVRAVCACVCASVGE